MYRLMIKTHAITGLNYLCMSQQDDYEKYSGSGIYWSKHLKKHGKFFHTQVLYESEDKDTAFIEQCLFYSELYDVVNNPLFANLIPENGNSSHMFNVVHPDHVGAKISSGLKNMLESNKGVEFRQSISNSLNAFFNTDAGEICKENRRQRQIKKMSDPEIRKYYSLMFKDIFDNLSAEEKLNRSKAISAGRLAMSIEDKQLRKDRIADSFKKSSKRKEYEQSMRVNRLGGKNPSAVKIEIDGVVFNSIKDAMQELDLSRSKINNRIKSNNWPTWLKCEEQHETNKY